MTLRYRLLVTDLDGTLLDGDGFVHERDRLAIAELHRRGVSVSICTGRMYSGTRAIARTLQLTSPIGCLDGSHIVDCTTDRELVIRVMAAETSASLMSILAEHRPATFVLAGNAVFHDERGRPFLSYVRAWSREVQPLDDVLEGWSDDNPVAALVALGSEAQIRASRNAIEDHEALQAVTFEVTREGHRGLWGMVVRAAGATKATALAWIADHHRIPLEEVIAVGDWLNDVPMLRAAGLSFAMGQALDEVKAAADQVLDADETTGGAIVEAAERAGLM